MLVIKTEIKPSRTHGLGLFALEAVEEGGVVMEPSTPGLDIELEESEFKKLPKLEQDFILHYGFVNRHTGKYHLTYDNTRFINHNPKNPNLIYHESTGRLLATQKILAGDELTQDYGDFEEIRKELHFFDGRSG
jgi:SET domain-containing protein